MTPGRCRARSHERKWARKPWMDTPACQQHACFSVDACKLMRGRVWRAADNAAGEVEKVGARCNCIIA